MKQTKLKTIGKLKDDSMFLLNYAESILHDKPIEKDTEKHKYEQSISIFKKQRSFIKIVVGGNITVL